MIHTRKKIWQFICNAKPNPFNQTKGFLYTAGDALNNFTMFVIKQIYATSIISEADDTDRLLCYI